VLLWVGEWRAREGARARSGSEHQGTTKAIQPGSNSSWEIRSEGGIEWWYTHTGPQHITHGLKPSKEDDGLSDESAMPGFVPRRITFTPAPHPRLSRTRTDRIGSKDDLRTQRRAQEGGIRRTADGHGNRGISYPRRHATFRTALRKVGSIPNM
jgi:hypothetical protein